MRAARATQLRCGATVAFSGFPGMARFNGSLQRLAVPALGLVELVGWMGRVGWEGGWIPVPAWTCSSEDAIEAKMALLLMLHAKGSAAALKN